MKTEKIKVLHLIVSRGIGGAEKVLLSLSKNINRDEFALILGIFMDKRRKENDDLFWKEAEKSGFPLEKIKFRNPYDLLQIRDIYRIVKRHHPDIIHTHGYRTNMLGFFVAKLLGIPFVTTVHGYQNNNKTRTIVQISSLLIRYFDQVIAVSDQMKENLKHGIAPLRKITTIRNVPHVADGEDLTNGSVAASYHTDAPIRKVYADKGYFGEPNRSFLHKNQIEDGIMRKATRSTSLTTYEKERNQQISKKRYIVEQYFGLSHLHNDAFRARFPRILRNLIDIMCRQMAFNLFRGARILGTA